MIDLSSSCSSGTGSGDVQRLPSASAAARLTPVSSSSCTGDALLEYLPQNLLREVFNYLPYGTELPSFSAGSSIQNWIEQATASGAAMEWLADYRSPSVPRNIAREQANAKIRRIQQAVRAAQQPAPPPAQAPSANANAPQPTPVTIRTLLEQQAAAKVLEKMEKTLITLEASKLPNDAFPPNVLKLLAEYATVGQTFLPEYPPTSFSPDKWNRFIGQVELVPKPPNIDAILASRCPVFPLLGKTVGETHGLYYIPPKVDGQSLTLRRFMTYIRNTKNSGNPIKLNIYWEKILETYGDQPLPSGWFLMLKTCLPGTKNKTYPEEQAVLNEFRQTNPKYRELHPILGAACTLLEYVQSGDSDTRLFSDEYARSGTILEGRHLDFGGFGPGGPRVRNRCDDCAYGSIGLGLVLPCGSSPAIGT